MSNILNRLFARKREVDRKSHWESIYTKKGPTEVSWFQTEPLISLDFVSASGVGLSSRIVDVGGGASVLVDKLLDKGFGNVTVLDISAAALEHARKRLGQRAGQVTWVEADATDYSFSEPFDLWHDRAVFHFLTKDEDRRKYVEAVKKGLRTGGHLIISTFDIDGPPKCSGLEIVRYDAEALRRELGGPFQRRFLKLS